MTISRSAFPTPMLLVAFVAFSWLCTAPSSGQSSASETRALQLLEAAQAPDLDPTEQERLLRKSLDAHITFDAAYRLGMLLRQESPTEALESFEVAREASLARTQSARALYWQGVCHMELGESAEAIAALEQSLHAHDNPKVREKLRDMELVLSKGVTDAQEINQRLQAATRVGGVAQVALRVQFDTDKATLDASGRKQAEEIATAIEKYLQDDPQARFLLLGHTDERGTEPYNEDLSRRRAQTVRDLVMDRTDVPPHRIEIRGCGESYPKYPGSSEEDYLLNRRVMLRVLDGKVASELACSP